MKSFKLLVVGSGMAFALPSAFVQAQDLAAADATPAQSGGLLDVIVVSASKRAQNIQSVGTAMTAISGEQISQLGTSDITAITTMVPSLKTYTYAPTVTVFNIRGVSQNDYSDAQEAPIAFYTDGAYVSSVGAISGQLFDINQVEVLRGPQGTLFGRNATGGVIQVESARPTPSLSGYVKLSAGSFGEYASEGAISGPLTDAVRGRVSFMTDNHDGYVTNVFNNTKLGNARTWALRGQVDADVAGGDLLVKVFHNRNDHETPAGYKAVPATQDAFGLGVLDPNGTDLLGYRDPYGPFKVSFDQQPMFDRKYYGGTATYTGNIGAIGITSITDYQHLDKYYAEDTDASPNRLESYISNQTLNQWSEELRLSSTMGAFKWVAGAYGLMIETRAGQFNGYQDIGEITTVDDTTHTRSIAVFGQGEYTTGRFTFITGLRGSFDRKSYSYHLDQESFAPADPGSDIIDYNPSLYPAAVRHDNNWSGKVELDYKPADHALLYAGINRGTKAGGYAAPGSNSVADADFIKLMAFGQEALTNYEAGSKLDLLDNRVRLNGSVFHYDYKGYQTFTNIGLQSHIANNPAKVDGAELEITASPIRGVTLNAYASFLHSRVYDVVLASGDSVERKMPQAPQWSGGASIAYTQPTRIGNFRIDTNWSYSGSYYFEAFNAPADYLKGYVVGDASLVFTPKAQQRLDISLSVKNVTDRIYHAYGYDLSALGLEQFTIGRPRWFLASLSYSL